MLESMLTKAPKPDCGAISEVKHPVHFQTSVVRTKKKDVKRIFICRQQMGMSKKKYKDEGRNQEFKKNCPLTSVYITQYITYIPLIQSICKQSY